jgi:hypothetical protein
VGKTLKLPRPGVIREARNTEERKSMVKRNSKLFAFIFFFFATSLLRGELESEKKLLFFFDKIEVNGNIDVFLVKGKRLREAFVYADTEIIQSIKTEVSRKTLFIDANNTYNIARRLPFIRLNAERTYPVEIVVSIEEIREIRLLGQSNLTAKNLRAQKISLFMASSGKLHIDNLDAEVLNVIHEGSGNILLKGNISEEMEVKVSENGTFIADELEVERATLIHQGNGIVHLKPNKWMDARILGNGNIFLHSKPERLIINKQGLGTIKDILPDSAPLYDLNNSK